MSGTFPLARGGVLVEFRACRMRRLRSARAFGFETDWFLEHFACLDAEQLNFTCARAF
jgi:hypothetical protein